MGREASRHRERRAVYTAIRCGTLQRRPPTAQEADVLFRAIDHKDVSAVGIRTLAVFDLDALYPMPQMHSRDGLNGVSFERKVTFLGYAAYRRRHEFVKHLLVAGAAPTLSSRQPQGAIRSEAEDERLRELLTRRFGAGMASAAAAYAVEYIAQLRSFAARDAALGAVLPPCSVCGEDGSTVCFDPCGCACCEGCVWGVLLKGNGDGELSCPRCGCRPPLRGNDGLIPLGNDESAVGRSRAEGKEGMESPTEGCSGMARAPPPEWTCECCAYTSAGARPCCGTAARLGLLPIALPQLLCRPHRSISAFRSSAAAARHESVCWCATH